MFGKIKRTVLSFAAVMAAFSVYRLVAEPLIEPSVAEKRVAASPPEDRLPVPDHQHRLGAYERLFPEGAWQRDNPIMLESDTAKLLMKEYTNLPGGLVRFKPCTLIFLPDGEAASANRRHRVIVLEAPQATMRFDGAVDLSRMKIGKLLGGILEGEITVTSAATRPDGGDEIFAVTHDVQLVGNQMFTSRFEDGRWVASPNDVQFRFGPNQGHGRGMQIDLDLRGRRQATQFQFQRRAKRAIAARCGNASATRLAGQAAGRVGDQPWASRQSFADRNSVPGTL